MMMIPPDHIMLLSVLERKRARTGCEVCTGSREEKKKQIKASVSIQSKRRL